MNDPAFSQFYSDEYVTVSSFGWDGNVSNRNGRSCSLLVQIVEQKGKFDPKKAMELHVPKGPLFGQLSAGETVLNTKGVEVRPEQVCAPSKPGPAFLWLSVHSEQQLQLLVNECTMLRDQLQLVSVVFHDVSTLEIRGHPLYRELLSHFHSTCSHQWRMTSHTQPLSFTGTARQTALLQTVCPQAFLSPPHPHASGMDHARALAAFCLLPASRSGWDLSAANRFSGECEQIEGMLQGSRALAEQGRLSYLTWDLVFLGTGCAIPSRYRNVSGILLSLKQTTCKSPNGPPDYQRILLDCGEDTVGTLSRLYAEVDDILATITAIVITHRHADHHLGLCRLLHRQWSYWMEHHSQREGGETFVPPLLILPTAVDAYVAEYAEKIGFPLHMVKCADVCNAMGITWNSVTFTTFRVDHCPGAFGISLDAPALRSSTHSKLVYTGDTQPYAAFYEHCWRPYILIHDSTFEDELVAEAREKKHSTCKEAWQSGQNSQAHCLIMTHFSQRYPKFPTLAVQEPLTGAPSHPMHTIVAFDGMRLDAALLAQLPLHAEVMATLLQSESQTDAAADAETEAQGHDTEL
jgi:ribonuclease Z